MPLVQLEPDPPAGQAPGRCQLHMDLLTDGIFEANPVVVGILLGGVALATLLALLRRMWHR